MVLSFVLEVPYSACAYRHLFAKGGSAQGLSEQQCS